jgi:hypothetical protein
MGLQKTLIHHHACLVGGREMFKSHGSPPKLMAPLIDRQIGRHSTKKAKSDAESFGRYLTVTNALLTRHSFQKKDIYPDLVANCDHLSQPQFSDERPRRIAGTRAFPEPGRTEAGLFERLGHRIPIEELDHEGRRVLMVHVPARLHGTAWQDRGTFWMRSGDAVVPMSDDRLRLIHGEAGPDFSAELCPAAKLSDLDPATIETLRRFWQRKAPTQDISNRSVERLLGDNELFVSGRLTHAALILLGTREALGRHLGQAEILFEYRSNETPGPAAERHEFRCGFLPILDEIWRLVNLRNDLQHFQQGLFVWDVPTLQERGSRGRAQRRQPPRLPARRLGLRAAISTTYRNCQSGWISSGDR